MQSQDQTTPPVPGTLRDRVRSIGMKVIMQEEELIRTLMPDADPERKKYPETEFRKHFLPIISGEAAANLPPGYTVQRLNEEAHQYWAQIAYGVNREVEVIDAAGEVAFIVPAISDTSMLNTAQNPSRAGLKILQEDVLQDAQGRPELANNRLLNGLERKIAELTSAGTGDRKRTVERIKKIHEYYGLKSAEQIGAESKPVNSGGFMGEMSFD